MQRICVFCGANAGADPQYVEGARLLGEVLSRRQTGLVFGGGGTGLMGAVADGVMSAGGDVIGVMPHALVERELAHENITSLEIVNDMHERKARMASLADGFIALPGGIGTMEELFEALTWTQLGIQQKLCGVLNVNGYYDSLIDFLNHGKTEGFIRDGFDDLLTVSSDPEQLVDALINSFD